MNKFYRLHALQLLAFLLFIIPLTSLATDNKEKPFVIPELKEWKGVAGNFNPSEKSRIVIQKTNKELTRIAKIFAEDYKNMFGVDLEVIQGKAIAGDFVFNTSPDKKLGEEGYQIKISDKVEISAPKEIGVFWATKTILQISEQNDKILPKGTIRDFPEYKLRGFMLDCGRKFIPLHFLQDYVKFMAYYKMNTFQIHLNDNAFPKFYEGDWDKTYSAFRLESETYPGLTAEDGYYTKQEFIDLQILAENNFVEIIPEIDVPAHSLAFSHYKPEIGSKEYGMDHLDLFNPETYKFADGLFDEYLKGDNPVFRGKRVHVGTDEYSNKKKEVVEKFRYFTDHYIRYVEKYGKQACVWGALTHARGETPVKSENVLMLAWHNPYAQPDSMIKEGYDLVSIPDGLLYIVPNAGYYYNYLNTKRLYETWTPANIGNKVFEGNPKVLGGMFAVWNDKAGNGVTTKDIHHRVLPAMQTLATKMWTGNKTTFSYDVFDEKRKNISEAPDKNIEGKIGNKPDLVYQLPNVLPNATTKHMEIGYDYTVSFDIEAKKEDVGTVLFESTDAKFYLSDPIKGTLGFSRDGYLETFNYRVKDGEKVNITITGNSTETTLYIDGKLKHKLGFVKKWFAEGKDNMLYSSTLVFPLGKSGDFKSKITNLKVYNYIK